jgi:hypothetical protein
MAHRPNKKDVTIHGCGTSKKIDQAQKEAEALLPQPKSGASGSLPPLPQCQAATCRLSSMRILPGTPGDSGDGLAKG